MRKAAAQRPRSTRKRRSERSAKDAKLASLLTMLANDDPQKLDELLALFKDGPPDARRLAEIGDQWAQARQAERAAALANVMAVLDEYVAAGVELDHTMEAFVGCIDWSQMSSASIKCGLREMLESTTNVQLRGLSTEADNERAILREYLADLEHGCEHQAAGLPCECKDRRLPGTVNALRAVDRRQWHQDLRDMRRGSGK